MSCGTTATAAESATATATAASCRSRRLSSTRMAWHGCRGGETAGTTVLAAAVTAVVGRACTLTTSTSTLVLLTSLATLGSRARTRTATTWTRHRPRSWLLIGGGEGVISDVRTTCGSLRGSCRRRTRCSRFRSCTRLRSLRRLCRILGDSSRTWFSSGRGRLFCCCTCTGGSGLRGRLLGSSRLGAHLRGGSGWRVASGCSTSCNGWFSCGLLSCGLLRSSGGSGISSLLLCRLRGRFCLGSFFSKLFADATRDRSFHCGARGFYEFALLIQGL